VAALTPYRILARKRAGETLNHEEIAALVAGATDGSWSEGQLAAFLMAAAINGLDENETQLLTRSMLESGDQWRLREELPTVGDKHSTGGVGDKVSLILSPLLAACGQPVVMLTGRGLGHTGGTADKLETIPGLDLEMNRERCLRLLDEVGMAIGVATGGIAPADRRLYAIRDVTATVDCLELIAASILSKKLASGAAAVAYDVKTGNGAFLREPREAGRLASLLVETSARLGSKASATITDMSQPLGDWVGHASEVRETLDCLAGRGPKNLMEVVYRLSLEVSALAETDVPREAMEEAIASGRARETFDRWVAAQGGDARRIEAAAAELAPCEVVIESEESGYLARVDTRRIGLLMAEAGAGRVQPGDEIDPGVSLCYRARLGRELAPGAEIARAWLRREDEAWADELRSCFAITEAAPEVPPLFYDNPASG
jgi:pyrimidine-nucleoside phosphorylase